MSYSHQVSLFRFRISGRHGIGQFKPNLNFNLILPVVDKLSHEFEDRCGAGWVVVPQLNSSL